jgi:hypothetical protein
MMATQYELQDAAAKVASKLPDCAMRNFFFALHNEPMIAALLSEQLRQMAIERSARLAQDD